MLLLVEWLIEYFSSILSTETSNATIISANSDLTYSNLQNPFLLTKRTAIAKSCECENVATDCVEHILS